MFDRLTALLRDAGVDLATEELLDVLWIATVRHAGEPEDELRPEGPAEASLTPDPGREELERPRERAHDPAEQAPAERREPSQRDGLYAPPAPGSRGGGAARAVGVRGTRSLSSPRALNRAMRPLRRKVPSRTVLAFDEDATVEWMAETELHEPVLRPEPERWLNAALVIDDGPSMVLWQQYAAEVRALLEGLGAFRDVRTYWLDSSGTPGALLRTRPLCSDAVPSAALRIDPARKTLVMVLSDMVGPGWSNGTVKGLLRHWARRAPVTVLQPLPERMWPSADGPIERLVVRSSGPAAPGRTLRVSHPVLPSELMTYSGTPVPVLELTKDRLEPWVSLLSTGHSRAALPVLLIPDGALGTETAHPSGTDAAGASAPEERLRRFREAASPESRQLAGALASVKPLTLPVMRLVHEAYRNGDGRFHQAQLAEVFLGGLLHRSGSAARTGAADSVEYEFVPGVADLLLDTVRTSVALDTAAQVSEYLLRRGRSGPEFRARLAGEGPGCSSDLPDRAGPFAAASPQLLRRLGLWDGPVADPSHQLPPGPEPKSAGSGAEVSLPEEPEGPAEVFVLEHVAPPLVDFARRLTADPAVPTFVHKRAQHLLDDAGRWRSGYGWPGIHAVSPLGVRLVDARQHSYRDELVALLRQLLEQLTPQTDLVSRNMRGNLAIALSSLGETDEGAAHLREVIRISREIHGADHPYTLNARQYLHELLYDAGRMAEAEAEGDALLETLEHAGLESDTGQRASVMRYQAYTLQRRKRYREAETLLRSVIALEEGPLTYSLDARLITRSWLAKVVSFQGRYAEAENVLRSGLDELELSGEEKGHGEAMALDCMADLLEDCERYEDAEPFRRATIMATERYWGPDHPSTYRARRDLVYVLRRLDRFAEARDEVEAVEPHLVTALGELHSETLWFRALRAQIHADLEEYDEAVDLQRQVLALGTDLFGPIDRTTLTLRHSLGLILNKSGRVTEAEGVLRTVLADECVHLGTEDSYTNVTRYVLADVLDSLGRTEEAIVVCRELLAIEERTLPTDSPETAKTRRRLATFLTTTGEHQEAAEHLGKAWTVLRRVTGPEAKESMSVGHAYGSALLRAERHDEALDVLEAVTRARSRVLGRAHPTTLASKQRFGDALAALGLRDRARTEWTAVRDTAASELGEDHEVVRTATQALERDEKASER
ncbi:tetratricopeptide repeat protein [Streptomyces sp. MS2A]|nr:tetratricopeptide repeat protein [Streptomyces sp. MS2A]